MLFLNVGEGLFRWTNLCRVIVSTSFNELIDLFEALFFKSKNSIDIEAVKSERGRC